MKKWLVGLMSVGMLAAAAWGQTVWFNEINYDPAGTDTAGTEWLEVAGLAGVDLSSYVVVLYNGANSNVYGTTTLSGVIDNEGCGYGAVELVYATDNSLQNGAPDGLALAQVSGGVTTLVQFISYEGAFTGVGGPANGVLSANIGSQVNTNLTLQLTGTATNYAGFAWATNAASMGTLNANQAITGCTPTPQTNVSFFASGATVNEDQGTYQVTVYKSVAAGDVSGQIALSGSATEGAGADYTIDTTNFTMNGATTSATFTVTINDDADSEAAENIVMTLANVVGAGTASPSVFTLGINASDVALYSIAIAPPTNGTVTTTPATEAAAGATVTIHATPAGGYVVGSITVTDADAGNVTVTGNTFTMPAKAVTVAVTFQVAPAGGALIISQYYEGSGSFNKWIEIYNPGASAVDLLAGGYRIGTWNNAAREGWKTNGAATLTVVLSNSISAGGTYLISPSGADTPAYAAANQTAALAFNGDDSVVLYTGATYNYANVVDAFGVTNASTTFGENKSFVRTNTVTVGVTTDYNAADWIQFTTNAVDSAAEGVNERIGYHSTGAAVFGVTFNKTTGFTVEQGASDSVTATAANGTAPYSYTWNSTLGSSFYTTNAGVFTILATAPVGGYTSTVVATDSGAQSVTNSIGFSVVTPAPKYAIAIVTNAPANGTVTTTPATEAAAGATVTVNATPAGGYRVATITVSDIGILPGTTFTMPGAPATVTVDFEAYVAPDVLLDFETNSTLSASTYAAGTSTVNSISFAHQRILRGNAVNDRVHGVYAGRLYPQTGTNAFLYNTAAFAEPITKISFWHANYGTENGTTFKVQVGSDGVSWADVGSVVDPESTNLTEVVLDSIPANATYFQFITVSGTARMNIDDIGLFFGAPVLGVTANRTNGFVVAEGSTDSITATAANGTAPYSYSWSSTLGSSYRTTNGNVFTILATAPTGSYSATVTATDSTLATAQKTVTFQVKGGGSGDPAVLVSGSLSGTVGVQMNLTITLTNGTAADWYIDLKDPDVLDDYSYGWTAPAFSLTPTKVGTYSLTATAVDGGDTPIATKTVSLTVSAAGGDPVIPPFALTLNGTGNFNFAVPSGYALSRVLGADASLNDKSLVWSNLTANVHYTNTAGNVTILTIPNSRKILRIGLTPSP